ncbi:tyrosine-protein phosphatase [Oenococcus oeni]
MTTNAMNDKRKINISGGVNFRDLGGYPSKNGHFVKWRKLVRAGDLSQLTTFDQRILINYGISIDIDLRSESETIQSPDLVPNGISHVYLPILNYDETESSATKEHLKKVYSSNARSGYLRMLYVYRQLVIDPQPQVAYKEFLNFLLKYGSDNTILFHCSAGKDRTGIIALLLLNALDVDSNVIKNDYLSTNQMLISRTKLRINEAKKSHMNKSFISSIIDLSSVSIDYYDQAMAIINYEFGGVHSYLRDYIGINDEMITKLKNIYLI